MRLSLHSHQITSLEGGVCDGLSNLQVLGLEGNTVTSIESGAFDGRTSLKGLYLSGNPITRLNRGVFDGLSNLRSLELATNSLTSLESGAFHGLTGLNTLYLWGNFAELNLAGATFQQLGACDFGGRQGTCFGGITTLVLDDAVLNMGSFSVIVGEARRITDVSLVGLTFSDKYPTYLSQLLGISTLDNVTV